MASLSWKAGFAGLAMLAATAYAVGQTHSGRPAIQNATGPGSQNQPAMQGGGMPGTMHARMMQMMQSRGMQVPHGMHAGMAEPGMTEQPRRMTAQPTMPGQDAFGAIKEVVQILEADPSIDWSKVNIAVLREHLIDMNEVTLRAAATERMLDDGIEIAVTGEGRTLEAIKRMVPAQVGELVKIGWNAKTVDLPNGMKLIVTTNDPNEVTRLKALGFMGIMVQGDHHQPHHLMIAKGKFPLH